MSRMHDNPARATLQTDKRPERRKSFRKMYFPNNISDRFDKEEALGK
jgi:hypothetical protein